jgi:hypothetical protein
MSTRFLNRAGIRDRESRYSIQNPVSELDRHRERDSYDNTGCNYSILQDGVELKV